VHRREGKDMNKMQRNQSACKTNLDGQRRRVKKKRTLALFFLTPSDRLCNYQMERPPNGPTPGNTGHEGQHAQGDPNPPHGFCLMSSGDLVNFLITSKVSGAGAAS